MLGMFSREALESLICLKNRNLTIFIRNGGKNFRNITSAKTQTLENNLVVFRRKYVKSESQATAKHNWHKSVFDPNTMKLPDFLDELNQGAEKAFGDHTQAKTGSFIYAKLLPIFECSVSSQYGETGKHNLV